MYKTPLYKKILYYCLPNIKLTGTIPIGGKFYYLSRIHKSLLFNRLKRIKHENVIFECYEKKIKENSIFYDIGANIGIHAIAASNIISKTKGKIFCFEPDPSNLKLLEENLQLNDLEAICEIVASAVGDYVGEVKFQRDLVSSATGSLSSIKQKSSQHSWMGWKSVEIQVSCISIDYMVFEKNLPPPSVVKIDVEGAEHFVLQGMERVIKEYEPEIIIDGLTEECFYILKKHNYHLYDLLSDSRLINDLKEWSFTVLASKI